MAGIMGGAWVTVVEAVSVEPEEAVEVRKVSGGLGADGAGGDAIDVVVGAGEA